MKRRFGLVALIVLMAVCYARSEPKEAIASFNRPTEWKALPGGKVCVEYFGNNDKGTLLLLFVDGSDPEIRYSKIKVRALDRDGKESVAEPADETRSKDAVLSWLYKNCSMRGGIYLLKIAKKDVTGITVGWKNDEVKFSPLD